MPRTRNVTRRQWDAANAQNNSQAEKENAYDSEKENASRVTRSAARAGSRRQILGTSSAGAPSSSATMAQTKGKGRGQPPSKSTSTKTGKLPLQDITRHFLPAPESANRGYHSEALFAQPEVERSVASPLVLSRLETLRPEGSRRTAPSRPAPRANPAYPSSLPPSSPPSVSSEAPRPQQEQDNSELPFLPPSPPLENLSRRLFAHAEEERPYNVWSELDFVAKEGSDAPSRAGRTPRNSDPFGFFALEKKLQEEREVDEPEDEAGGLVLVADTSSPRPVRRLRPRYVLTAAEEVASVEDEPQEGEEEAVGQQEFPPTPHKTKGRSRHSFGDATLDHLFSPRSSSCPSSPSPSKPSTSSSTKRKAASSWVVGDEGADEEESKSSIPLQKVPGKKQAKLESDDAEPSTRRQLRSRSAHQKAESSKTTPIETRIEEKRKGRSTKRASAVKKGKSKKVVSNKVDDPDSEEWERERQVRLEYYRQLEEYDFETENVYIV